MVVLNDGLSDALEGIVLWRQDGDIGKLVATLSEGGDDVLEEVVDLCLKLILWTSLLPLMDEDSAYLV